MNNYLHSQHPNPRLYLRERNDEPSQSTHAGIQQYPHWSSMCMLAPRERSNQNDHQLTCHWGPEAQLPLSATQHCHSKDCLVVEAHSSSSILLNPPVLFLPFYSPSPFYPFKYRSIYIISGARNSTCTVLIDCVKRYRFLKIFQCSFAFRPLQKDVY